eukprot:9487427-Pyramimonas_sp.AAC.1
MPDLGIRLRWREGAGWAREGERHRIFAAIGRPQLRPPRAMKKSRREAFHHFRPLGALEHAYR